MTIAKKIFMEIWRMIVGRGNKGPWSPWILKIDILPRTLW